MHFDIMCPHCKKRMKVSENSRGKPAICPFCAKRIILDAPQSDPPSDPPLVIPAAAPQPKFAPGQVPSETTSVESPRPHAIPADGIRPVIPPQPIAPFTAPEVHASLPVQSIGTADDVVWHEVDHPDAAPTRRTARAKKRADTTKLDWASWLRSLRWTQLVAPVAAAVLLIVLHLTVVAVGRRDWLWAFLDHRGGVQHVTSYVACLAAVLLAIRGFRHAVGRMQFQTLQTNPNCHFEPVAKQLQAVATVRDEEGKSAAGARCNRLIDENLAVIQAAYGAIRLLCLALLVLGLLGAMQELSSALFIASAADVPDSNWGQQVLIGLATALDTAFLTLALIIPLFVWSWLQGRSERRMVQQHANYIRERYGLGDKPAMDATTALLQEELHRLVRKIGWEARTTFEQLLEDATKTYQQQLQQTTRDLLPGSGDGNRKPG